MFDEEQYEDMDSDDDEENYQASWSGEEGMSVIEGNDQRISLNAFRRAANSDLGNPKKSNHFSE